MSSQLPLSASVTDPGNLHEEGSEKNISLINGNYTLDDTLNLINLNTL